MKVAHFFLLIVFLAVLGTGCAGPTSQVRPEPAKEIHTIQKTYYGVASWYGREHHGLKTASGERFDMYDHTAAHRSLPFGTRVRVTNLRNNHQTVVRINDRGPFVRGREIDLSYAAARDIRMLESGVEKVRLEVFSG